MFIIQNNLIIIWNILWEEIGKVKENPVSIDASYSVFNHNLDNSFIRSEYNQHFLFQEQMI